MFSSVEASPKDIHLHLWSTFNKKNEVIKQTSWNRLNNWDPDCSCVDTSQDLNCFCTYIIGPGLSVSAQNYIDMNTQKKYYKPFRARFVKPCRA